LESLGYRLQPPFTCDMHSLTQVMCADFSHSFILCLDISPEHGCVFLFIGTLSICVSPAPQIQLLSNTKFIINLLHSLLPAMPSAYCPKLESSAVSLISNPSHFPSEMSFRPGPSSQCQSCWFRVFARNGKLDASLFVPHLHQFCLLHGR
jgi:hypothetical protein